MLSVALMDKNRYYTSSQPKGREDVDIVVPPRAMFTSNDYAPGCCPPALVVHRMPSYVSGWPMSRFCLPTKAEEHAACPPMLTVGNSAVGKLVAGLKKFC